MPVMKSTLSRLMLLLDQLAGDVGLELVVDHEHLGRQAAELAAVQLHREQEAVADVDAERPARPRQRADEADLDLVGRLGRQSRHRRQQQRRYSVSS